MADVLCECENGHTDSEDLPAAVREAEARADSVDHFYGAPIPVGTGFTVAVVSTLGHGTVCGPCFTAGHVKKPVD